MKAFLIDTAGFKKTFYIDRQMPVIEMMRPPEISFTTADIRDVVRVTRMVFYYDRYFYNEDDERVLIYKERL